MSLTACSVNDERPPENDNGIETPQEEPADTSLEIPSDNDDLATEVVTTFTESFEDAEDPLEIRVSMELIMKTESVKTSDAVL